MPFKVWRKIHESGNFMLVLIKGNATAFECLLKWYNLQDEWISKFGHSEDYKELLETKREACIKMAQYLQSQDRFQEFESKIALEEIADLELKTVINTLGEEKAKIQRATGLRIDESWTVDDYYYQKKELING